MRFSASIAFLLLYVVFTGGLQVLVHTCGGHTSFDVMPASAEDPCGCSDEPATDRCCTTQLVTLKLDADQKAAVPVPAVPDLLFTGVADPVRCDAPAPVFRASFTTPSPPGRESLPIFHCTLLI